MTLKTLENSCVRRKRAVLILLYGRWKNLSLQLRNIKSIILRDGLILKLIKNLIESPSMRNITNRWFIIKNTKRKSLYIIKTNSRFMKSNLNRSTKIRRNIRFRKKKLRLSIKKRFLSMISLA